MKAKELLITGIVYVVVVTIAYFITMRLTEDAAGLSQAVGTIAAVLIAGYLYQSRNHGPAPIKVKLTVAATLAAVCALQSLIFQHFLKWMAYPDISILFGALGALIFSLILWNVFVKGITPTHKK